MAVRGGIFSTERRAWIAVGVYTIVLYSTLTLAFRAYVWLFERLGDLLPTLMTWIYLPLGISLLTFISLLRPRRAGAYLCFCLIALGLAFCLSLLTVPAKRFHFIEYGPLTVLVFDALRFRCRDHYHYVWALAIVALIGLGDEILQGLLPNRYFGVLDLVVNSTAGLLTLAFIGFVIGEENYPLGNRRRVPKI